MLLYIPIRGDITATMADGIRRLAKEHFQAGNTFVLHINSFGGEASYFEAFWEFRERVKNSGGTLIAIGQHTVSSLALYVFCLADIRFFLFPMKSVMMHDIQVHDPNNLDLKAKYDQLQNEVDGICSEIVGVDNYFVIPRNIRLSPKEMARLGKVVDVSLWHMVLPPELQDESRLTLQI